jgi:hypothetical protein
MPENSAPQIKRLHPARGALSFALTEFTGGGKMACHSR